jgi:CheY-like chemotaxis protein
MDIKLPNMDGNTASKLIKAIRPDLPIIAQSAYVLKHEIGKNNDYVFDDYIAKPIDADELKNKLNQFLKK